MNEKRRDPGMMTFEFADDGGLVPDYGPGNPLSSPVSSPGGPETGTPSLGWGASSAPMSPHTGPVGFGTPASAPGSLGTALLFMPVGGGRDALAAAVGSAGLSVLVSDNPLSVASVLYGLRPAVVLVDAAQGPFMASQSVQWLRLSAMPVPVVSIGNVQPAYVDAMTRAGVAHCVPYPSDLALFATQVMQLVRASPPPPPGATLR